MKKYAYDIEIFPNFFSVIFKHLFSEEKFVFYVYFEDNGEVFENLLSFIETSPYLIGYNNSKFDDIIINKILKSRKIDVGVLYKFAQNLIKASRRNEALWQHKEFKWYLRPFNRMYKSIDLMKILAFDKMKIGLKQCSVNLKHERIQDLPKKYDQPVLSSDEIPVILDYNENDVNITRKLFFRIKKDLILRHNIGEEYSVNVMNSSNTHIAKTILNYYYEDQTGIAYNDFRELRSNRDNINFSECINEKIKYSTPQFNQMLDDLNRISIQKTKGAIDYKLMYNGKGYQLGTGGLHSMDDAGIFKETDAYYLIDADVSSFYPNIMLNFKIKPEHLSEEFFDILKFLTEKRLKAKAEKDKTTADALKISINSIYGLLNFPYYWLYDPKASISVTINGQLLLLMLVERLEVAGFEVISANTDGVTAKVPIEREDEYYTICKKWENDVDFELEYAYYTKYVRRNVNSYITHIRKKVEKGNVYETSEVKKKKDFLTEVELNKAFRMPIVAIALEKYYIDNIPIAETLRSHEDIMDFCKSQNVGSQFTVEHHVVVEDSNGLKNEIVHLQKTNRYFISKNGGTILKRKADVLESGSLYNLEAGYLTTILNNYEEEVNYLEDIDFSYYENECRKVINDVSKNGQLSIFDLI